MTVTAADSVPLYLGIPLAAMCIAAVVAFILIGIAFWRDHQ